MIPGLPANIDQIKGFLADDEAEALYDARPAGRRIGPVLEIGSYCGKSTIYLGLACRETGSTVFALDHHRGSEEHQQGEFFHDPDLYDDGRGVMDTFQGVSPQYRSGRPERRRWCRWWQAQSGRAALADATGDGVYRRRPQPGRSADRLPLLGCRT